MATVDSIAQALANMMSEMNTRFNTMEAQVGVAAHNAQTALSTALQAQQTAESAGSNPAGQTTVPSTAGGGGSRA